MDVLSFFSVSKMYMKKSMNKIIPFFIHLDFLLLILKKLSKIIFFLRECIGQRRMCEVSSPRYVKTNMIICFIDSVLFHHFNHKCACLLASSNFRRDQYILAIWIAEMTLLNYLFWSVVFFIFNCTSMQFITNSIVYVHF